MVIPLSINLMLTPKQMVMLLDRPACDLFGVALVPTCLGEKPTLESELIREIVESVHCELHRTNVT